MHLTSEFFRLPLQFDHQRLAEEALRFPESDWTAHPQGYAGNSAIVLVSANGKVNDDYFGPMSATRYLDTCPYIQQVLSSFNTVIGRSRLMRLEPGSEVSAHSDANYLWINRTRIHVPIVTDAGVRFFCNDKDVHMQPGEAWIFDNWLNHKVKNNGSTRRIHLVIDTTGSSAFWKLLQTSWKPGDDPGKRESSIEYIPYTKDRKCQLEFEQYNAQTVIPPGEMDCLLQKVVTDIHDPDSVFTADITSLGISLDEFRQDWRCTWSLYQDTPAGWPYYRSLIQRMLAGCRPHASALKFSSNNYPLYDTLKLWMDAALMPETYQANTSVDTRYTPGDPATLTSPILDRPVFIVSSPRSGSTLLYEILVQNQGLYNLGGESHALFESIAALHPSSHGFDSNRLTAKDATDEIAVQLMQGLTSELQSASGMAYLATPGEQRPRSLRLLEKTPKNALRIPFLMKLFPDAIFIFLTRSAPENISSIMEAWKSGRFTTYPGLPGWEGPPWSLLLPEGWRQLKGSSLVEIAAFQWHSANKTIADDLAGLPASQWYTVHYEDLLADSAEVIRQLCDFIDVPFGPRMQQITSASLPHSKYTLTRPDPDKWKTNAAEIEQVLAELQPLQARLDRL